MTVPILTTLATIVCPHGGQLQLLTTDTLCQVQHAYALLETDVHPVVGCPFTLPSGTPSPCLEVRWSAGATRAKVSATPMLLMTSVGICYSATRVPQGVAIVLQTQQIARSI